MKTHPEFAPVAIIAAVSLFAAVPWHWRSGNLATIAIIIWLFLSNIIFAVDAIIWSDNIRIVAEVWCDITTKFIIGANFALPAACLCICIHLEQVASGRTTHSSVESKRRRQLFEFVMSFGLPCVFMALHYVVQGHRFDIVEGFGCRPTTYFSVPAIFIVWLSPLLISIVAMVFSGLALRHFMRRRVQFASHVSSRSRLTASRYLRLMLMAALLMTWNITITSFSLAFTTIGSPIRRWTTWSDVHSNFSRVDQYPAFLLPPFIARPYTFLWWTMPSSTFIFVSFFAFGHDALVEYKKFFGWCSSFFRRTRNGETDKKNFLVMPMTPSSKTSVRGLPMSEPKLATSTSSTTTLTIYYNDKIPSTQGYSKHVLDLHLNPSNVKPTQAYPSDVRASGSASDLSPSTDGFLSPDMPTCILEPEHVSPAIFTSPISPPLANVESVLHRPVSDHSGVSISMSPRPHFDA